MIYITYRECEFGEESFINNIWFSSYKDLNEKYESFMVGKSKEMNITINPKWFMVMDYKIHNSHLTDKQFQEKEKEWVDFLEKWDFDHFIEDSKLGIKQDFKNIYH